MNHLNTRKSGNVIGMITVVFFALCMFWGLILVDPVLKELHLNILKITFPGFSMTAVGILIGAIESFIYGWIFGALFARICRKVCVSGK